MVRSIRIVGKFLWLGLMSGALALPLAAEEVTVTIPPDDPPAQAAPQPGASPSLPSFSAGNSAPKPVADSSDLTAHATDNASAPPPPAAPVKHKTKLKKAAATAPAASPAPEAAASSATASPAVADDSAKPADKPKTAKASPCLNLEESACGSNSACIWVAAGTNDAGKATKARCRSLAILKKEAAKAAKASKTGAPEVLPWAAGSSTSSTTPATATGTTTATAETTKPVKKTKTASAKKTPKPKPETAPAAAPAGGDGDAAAPASSGSAPEPDTQQGGGGAD